MDSFSFDSSSDDAISYIRPAPHGLKPAIHSVHKTASPSKPWRKPAAVPNSPKKTRVYQVDRMNFRQLVQELTGAVPELTGAVPERNTGRLHKVGPPHLNLTTGHSHQPRAPKKSAVMSEETVPEVSLGLGLSPTSAGWCSFLTLSPTTLSSFGSGTML